MELAEYAPDDELGEKLRFEWPEETGLTLDDFDVYKMFDRDDKYLMECPLWVAVCESSVINRRLIQSIYSGYSMFVAINKPLDQLSGLHFVRTLIRGEVTASRGWCAPIIAGWEHTGYVFTEKAEAALFQMRQSYQRFFTVYPRDLEAVEHCLLRCDTPAKGKLIRKLCASGVPSIPVYDPVSRTAVWEAYFTEQDAIIAQSMLDMLEQ